MRNFCRCKGRVWEDGNCGKRVLILWISLCGYLCFSAVGCFLNTLKAVMQSSANRGAAEKQRVPQRMISACSPVQSIPELPWKGGLGDRIPEPAVLYCYKLPQKVCIVHDKRMG